MLRSTCLLSIRGCLDHFEPWQCVDLLCGSNVSPCYVIRACLSRIERHVPHDASLSRLSILSRGMRLCASLTFAPVVQIRRERVAEAYCGPVVTSHVARGLNCLDKKPVCQHSTHRLHVCKWQPPCKIFASARAWHKTQNKATTII